MVRRRHIVESEEYESKSEAGSSYDPPSRTSCNLSRDGSSSDQVPIADLHKGYHREGLHPGDNRLFPGGRIGERRDVLTVCPPSNFSKKDLLRFKKLYSIPSDYKVCVPIGDQRADWDVLKGVCLYERVFQIGLRLSLPSIVKRVLGYFKVALCQLMPNAWRVLLGFQVLYDIQNVEAPLEVFRFLYALSHHNSEEGRITIGIRAGVEPLIPYTRRSDRGSWKERYLFFKEECVFGPKGPGAVPLFWQDKGSINNDFPRELTPLARSQLDKILEVPWLKRKADVLLSLKYFARTSIWSTCIASSGLEATVFVKKFKARAMERPRVKTAPSFADFAGGAKKKAKRPKKPTADTSMVLIDLPDVIPSSGVALRKGKSSELVQSVDGSDRVDMGKGVALLVDPSSFQMEGNFKLADDISGIRGGGLSVTNDYAISLLARGFQAVVALKEDAESAEQEHKASIERMKREYASVISSNAVLKEEATNAKTKMRDSRDLLERERGISEKLRVAKKKEVHETMIYTRRDLMEEMKKRKHLGWDLDEEIAKCDALLEVSLEEDEGEEEDEDVDPAASDQGNGSFRDDPTV